MKLGIALWALALASVGAWAGEAATEDGRTARREARAAAAVEAFRSSVPARFFEEAYGYAVVPRVTRVGAGLGGAWGKGVAYERGRVVGTVRYWQATSGIQAGAASVSLIVFFRDAAAFEDFRDRGIRFSGQAGLTLVTAAHYRTPAYDSGVAMFARSRFGLMFEATIAATGLSLVPPP